MSMFHTSRSRSRRGRMTTVALLAAGAVSVATIATASASSDWSGRIDASKGEAPSTPNPYVAFLPNAGGDFAGWNTYAETVSKAQGQPPRGPRSAEVAERPGNNDRPQGAQRIFLDTRRGDEASIDVIGRGAATSAGTTTELGELVEPDDSFGEATTVALSVGDTVTGSGEIASTTENPFDFDVLELSGLAAGTQVIVDIDTPEPFADLDSYVTLWDRVSSEPIAEADDDGESLDSRLVFNIPAEGTYYAIIAGFGAFGPLDPTDPVSPSVTGDVGSQGSYDFSVELAELDNDWYKVDLRQGDIFGAALFDGAGRVELYGPDGELLIGSSQDLTFIHPPSSPLPGGGNAAASYVIAEAGRHTIKVDTSGDYRAQFRAFRPLGESEDRPSQILFVDFDGGSVDPGIYFGGPFGFEVELSPLSAFLAGWGLAPGDEDAVIDAILASVEENIDHDIEAFGSNGAFDIDIRNSRDHDDPWGDPNVSRIIVGGTILELGIPTIGIAQSIDVGNFDTEETAVVLLDLLSGTGPFPAPDVDLNLFPLDPSVSIIDIVGEAVGSVTAHEAGHFFANWHTDQFNPTANVMDQGGNLPGLLGVGPDGVFGSGDDVDVDFGHDTFVPNEGFTGTEDTLESISFGLWSAID